MEEELLVGFSDFTLLLFGTRTDGAVADGHGAVKGGGAGYRKDGEGAVLACPVDA